MSELRERMVDRLMELTELELLQVRWLLEKIRLSKSSVIFEGEPDRPRQCARQAFYIMFPDSFWEKESADE